MFNLFFGFQKRPQAKGFQPQSKRYQGPAMRLEEMRTPSGLVLDDTETTEGLVADSDLDVEFPSEEGDMGEDWSGKELEPESLDVAGDGSTETDAPEEELEDLPFLYGDIDDESNSESDGNDITKSSDAETDESYSDETAEILNTSPDSFDSTDPEFEELDWIETDDSSDESTGDESELNPDDEFLPETVEEAIEEKVLTTATEEIDPEVDEPDILAQLSKMDAQEDTTSDAIETLTQESDDIGADEVEAEDSSLLAEPDEVKESEFYNSFAESNNTTVAEIDEGVEPQADNTVGDSENQPLVTEETETNINDEGVEPQADNSIGDSESEPLVTEETDTKSDDEIEDSDTSKTEETTDDSEAEESELVADAEFANLTPKFESGTFKVGDTGQVEVDFIFDGGAYKGQVAIVSLSGMEGLDPNSREFFLESISRAASNSELGYMVIDDNIEGARFEGRLGEGNYNSGEYQGVKSFAMRPGDEFFLMLVPNGTVQQVLNNPNAGGALRPLFSLTTANPEDGYHFGQIADITGDGSAFAWEDIRVDGNSDRDYNDIVLQFRGATGKAALMDDMVADGKDWRGSDLGQAVIEYVKTYVTPEPVSFDVVVEDLLADLESLFDEADSFDENLDIGTDPEVEDDISLVNEVAETDLEEEVIAAVDETEVVDDVAQTPIEEELIAAGSETEVASDVAETDVEQEALAAETETEVSDDVVETDVEFETIATEGETEVTDVVETDVEFEAIAAETESEVAEEVTEIPFEEEAIATEGETEVASDVAETDAEEELIAAEAETEVTDEIEGETEAADEVGEIPLEEEAIAAEDETAVGEDPEEEAIAPEDGTEVASDVEETSVEEEVIAAETETEVASDVEEADIEFEATAAEGETEVADEVTEIPVEFEAIAAESENSSQTPVAAEETQNTAPSVGTSDTEPVSPTSPIETRVISDTDAIATPAISPNDLAKTELISRLDNLTQTLKIQANNSQTSTASVNPALIERLQTLTQNLQNQNSSRPISESTLALVGRLEKMVEQTLVPAPIAPLTFSFPASSQPLVGIVGGGFTTNNSDIDYSRITWGRDHIDGDSDPTLPEGSAHENATDILEIIAAQRDNGIGIDGINPDAPIWAGRASGSEKWIQSVVEFVDAARESGQPNAVVNLSLDLTQIDAEGNVTTRYELTPQEREVFEYARQHNVLIVVPAGCELGQISALGNASLEFDNVITVGAATRVNDAVALSKAYEVADESGTGIALDLVASGNSYEAPAKVTGAISQVWAANPRLNYTQVIDIIKRTATDLGQPNWDSQTGAGLLNMTAAITLAKATEPEPYTVKPGQRTITDNFVSSNPGNKPLPGDPTHPAATVPSIPKTTVDTGGNSIQEATQLLMSPTVDIIDQVSSIDPVDVFRMESRYLQGADFSVLDGELSIKYLTPEGQLLGTQILGKGSHTLELPGNVTGEVLMKVEPRNQNPATYMLYGFESTEPQPFNIDLEFDSPLSASQKKILEAAAKNVASLIGQGLPTAIVDGKIIDDINIKISTADLDGAGGTQARTKIDFMRYGSLLPAQSLVQLDAADIAELEQSGSLFDVAQHEFLHALGFGNLWEAKGLVNYAGTPLAQYNGKNAVDEFQKAGGLTDTVALETEGDGSASLHWHQQLFPDEIMTADLNGFTGQPAPVSAVTIASLADLGYVVNLDRATPGYQLFGSQTFDAEDITPEQIEAFRQLAEMSFEDSDADYEYIAPIMPSVDPDKVAPEIWAHAERFWKNKEYYDWVPYQIRSGDTLSHLALRYLGNAGYDYYMWIANRNGIPNSDYIVTGNWIQVPQHHPNYAWKQEQERLRREAELKKKQEEEARIRKEQEEAFAREQERVRQQAEARQREAEAKQRELEEQERRLREQMERHRQEEERRIEEARLAELARQAEIARQQGKAGLDWYIATPLPEFGPVDPFETRMTGQTVGNLVPDHYYRFTLSRNGRITAELRQLLADADLVLYDVRSRPIAYSMREGITDEHIIADLIPGTYMLRVNSPKGVTTDYELVVKFKHLLSQTEQGPPPGWQVGGGSNGGGGGAAAGALFSDPRIQRIYDTALNNFSGQERAKANAQVADLQKEKRSYEQQMQALLDKMNAEQRAKVHQALDDARNSARSWVDVIVNPIKNTVDSLGNGIKNKANSVANTLISAVNNIPDLGMGWAKNLKEEARKLIRQGRDAVNSAVNSAQSWLKGQLTTIQNNVKSAISRFFETIKNAYRTGGEINQIIANAANAFRSTIDQAVRGANELVGKFKGRVLSAVEGTKNLGINIDILGKKFGFNVYNQVVKPAVDAIASGVSSTINGVGNTLKGITNWLEPRTQDAVAKVVNALFGDQTGHLWNKIHGVDAKIAATRTGLERVLSAAKQHIGNIARQIEAFLSDPEERKRVLEALWKWGFKTIEDAYNFIIKKRDEVRKQIKAEKEARRKAQEEARRKAEEESRRKAEEEARRKAQEEAQKPAYAKKLFADSVRTVLQIIKPGHNYHLSAEASGILSKALSGGKIKRGVNYEISRSHDGSSYSVLTKFDFEAELAGGPNSPVSGKLSLVGIAGQDIKVHVDAKATVEKNVSLGISMEHEFDVQSDDDMVTLGLLAFQHLPTPGSQWTDPLISHFIQGKNLVSIKPFIQGSIAKEFEMPSGVNSNSKGYISVVPLGDKDGNWLTEITVGLEGSKSFGFSEQLGLGLAGEATFALEINRVSKKIEKIAMTLETDATIPNFLSKFEQFAPNSNVVQRFDDFANKIELEGKAMWGASLDIQIQDPLHLMKLGSSVQSDIIKIAQSELLFSENLSDFSEDVAPTLRSIMSLLRDIHNSTTISVSAKTTQVASIEAEGKVFLGGGVKAELGFGKSFEIWSNK